MKAAWNVVLYITLGLLVLGGVCFGLSLVMGADLVRIADGVFSRYDLAQTLLNVRALIAQALAIF